MIKTKSLTPNERAEKIKALKQEHVDYLSKIDNAYAFIPKMAYRPSGKDDKYITFFPSELETECDIYTEFVSKQYESEDPKRTLYLMIYNPFWKEEYERHTSKSGFTTHLVPVSELKVINDVTTRGRAKQINHPVLPIEVADPTKGLDHDIDNSFPIQGKTIVNIDIKDLVKVIEEINYTLQTLNHILRNK